MHGISRNEGSKIMGKAKCNLQGAEPGAGQELKPSARVSAYTRGGNPKHNYSNTAAQDMSFMKYVRGNATSTHLCPVHSHMNASRYCYYAK
jgi:hypothetical protein